MNKLKILFFLAFCIATINSLQCGSNEIENCKRCHPSKTAECSQCESGYSLDSPGTTNTELHATSCKEGSGSSTIYIAAAIIVGLCLLVLLILIPSVLWYKYNKQIKQWYSRNFYFLKNWNCWKSKSKSQNSGKKFEKKQLKKRNRKSPYVFDNEGTGSVNNSNVNRQAFNKNLEQKALPMQPKGGYKFSSKEQNGMELPLSLPPQPQPQPQMKMIYGPTNYNQY